tara:strand:- start:5567 stop:6217 length:651 start_codon:yes stop_codon:yes gene_type:complete
MSNELKKRILSSILLTPLLLVIIIKGSIIFNLFLIIIFCVILYEWYKISKITTIYYLGIFFLIFSFYAIYNLRNYNNDYINFLFVLIICISTDIGGYVFGKLFKGPKLTSISPNKTYSGVLGGYLFSIASVYFFFQQTFIFSEKKDIFFITYIIVLLISTVSQLGDILVSYFKRLSKIKDTGNIIPGHGGLLDRADGMIFAFPFSYIILLINYKFF